MDKQPAASTSTAGAQSSPSTSSASRPSKKNKNSDMVSLLRDRLDDTREFRREMQEARQQNTNIMNGILGVLNRIAEKL